MTQSEILALFKETHALLDGHFQLTSGLHSPQYFQCARVLQFPKNAERVCAEIASRFRSESVDVVAAPALGGIVVGQEVARQLGARSIFAERSEGKLQLRRGFEIGKGERVLVCEDVITTGDSVRELIDLVSRYNGKLMGVGVIVDRSGARVIFPNFYALVTLLVTTYQPDHCPLCEEGIPVEKPGSRKAIQKETL